MANFLAFQLRAIASLFNYIIQYKPNMTVSEDLSVGRGVLKAL